MAKIDINIPDPAPEFSAENQQQIVQALNQIKNKLNFTYQQDLKNEQDTFNFFLS